MTDHITSKMPLAQAAIEPSVFDVYRPTTVRVSVRPNQPVRAGSVISVQLPNSFLAFRFTQSHTQRLQCQDPAAPHYVSVALADPRLSAATFEIKIAPYELITDDDPRQEVRHGQRVFATVRGGEVPTGAEVIFSFARMHTPWVANQTEYFYVAIDGQVLEPWPTFRVRPGPAVWQRLIVPSSARPGELFRVLLVSLDEYDNVSSTTYSGASLAVEGGEALQENIAFQGRYETNARLPQKGIFRLIATGLLSEYPLADGGNGQGGVVFQSDSQSQGQTQTGPYWGGHFTSIHTSAAMPWGNEPYPVRQGCFGPGFRGACADHANAHLPQAMGKRIKGMGARA